VSSVRAAVSSIVHLTQTSRRGYVCLANVHMCMTALDDADFAKVLAQASLVLADGRPVYWAQRLLGARTARQVRGVDLMLAVCAEAQQQGLKLGLYGGKDAELLQQLQQQLALRFPNLIISYAWAPPFRPLSAAEDASQCLAIEQAEVDILLVGIGCPKQEMWMASHQQLNAVMLGVGAAFDFVAGTKQQAPVLLQRFGFEWVHRLLSEPVRLSGRYLRNNPRFLLRFVGQWLQGCFGRHRDSQQKDK
jgi:N-acetylglucosaminyldiphosphoundecaprenol N-acetyl-beta-D-mannosaminyltransferase